MKSVTPISALDEAFARALEERLLVDTSEGRPVHLVAARNGAYIRLSPSAYRLLRDIAAGASFEEVAQHARRAGGLEVSAADVESAYQRLRQRIDRIEANARDPRGAFWFKRQLVPATAVAHIAAVLKYAYRPLVVGLLFALIGLGSLLAFRSGLRVDTSAFWPAYALFILSLSAHELGHASACAHFGRKPSEIGFTLYLIYPAFYSDVSAAWTLGRWQRVVVDLGGCYFQLVAGAVYSIAYSLTGWEPLRLALLMIGSSVLFSLNPILKFDGYWVLSDALGVTNLAKQPARFLRSFGARLLGRQVKPLPWSPVVTALLGLYSVMSIGFWVWFVVTAVPAVQPLLHGALDSFRSLWTTALKTHVWPDSATLRNVATAGYVLLLPILIAWRILRVSLVYLRKLFARARSAVNDNSILAR